LLWVAALSSLACRDYPYRHEIRGVVVGADSKPIKGAAVRRITDKGDQYGVDELYLRRTNDDGGFEFVSDGRGPSPLPEAPWKMEVEYPAGTKHSYDVSAKWSDDKTTCQGYCARDVHIVLR
jgi:hypothetical protein